MNPTTPLEGFDAWWNSLQHRRLGLSAKNAARLAWAEKLVPSETASNEGYPGIAHDFETMRTALKRSITAIDDWLNTYASELCDERRVQEAVDRISEMGTLAYIADVQEQNRKALNGK